MVNSASLAKPVSQSLIVASRALLQWTLQSQTPHGTVMERKNKQQQGAAVIMGQQRWENHEKWRTEHS
jgi:hypothetical protein